MSILPCTSRDIDNETTLLVEHIVNEALEAKGDEIKVLEIDPRAGVADFFIVMSGRSDRQAIGIANRIFDKLKKEVSLIPYSIEGFETGHWIILDYGNVVAHVFYEETRKHYDLERLWIDSKQTLVVPTNELFSFEALYA